MPIYCFQDLHVWKKGHKLVLDVYKITKSYPSDERFGLVSQLRRSSSSVCANLSEGYRKKTNDFIRYIEISRASLEETKYHLVLSRDLSYIDKHNFESLYDLAESIGKMLDTLRRKLRQK